MLHPGRHTLLPFLEDGKNIPVFLAGGRSLLRSCPVVEAEVCVCCNSSPPRHMIGRGGWVVCARKTQIKTHSHVHTEQKQAIDRKLYCFFFFPSDLRLKRNDHRAERHGAAARSGSTLHLPNNTNRLTGTRKKRTHSFNSLKLPPLCRSASNHSRRNNVWNPRRGSFVFLIELD